MQRLLYHREFHRARTMCALNVHPLFAGRNEITAQLRPSSATKRGRKVIHAHA